MSAPEAAQGSVDVAVVGGGLAGAPLAVALAQAGLTVAVVEASPPPAPVADDALDARVSAVNEASENVLRNLGVWPLLPRDRITPYQGMRVWDGTGAGMVRFDADSVGVAHLGAIVENRVLLAALAARLEQLPAVSWHRPSRLQGFQAGPAGVTLRLGPEPAVIEARLVVGADGARSRVRELAGIEIVESPYGHDALVALVSLARPHGHVAYQRFLDTGPLAFLPMPRDHCAVVWSAGPERVDHLVELSPEDFEAELGEAMEHRFGGVALAGPRLRYPLVRRHARSYAASRAVLVGDAAHTIHPLAGLGANLGLLDVAALAEVLAGAREGGEDLGDPRVLARYSRWRRGHNLLVQAAMGAFKTGFASPAPPLRLALGLGLGVVDRSPVLQRLFARQAMGRIPALPRLARSPTPL